MASLMFTFLRELRLNVREMHSRKPQLYRTRISDEFKESKRLILITSDVSARGMNYPDVTLVIQVLVGFKLFLVNYFEFLELKLYLVSLGSRYCLLG